MKVRKIRLKARSHLVLRMCPSPAWGVVHLSKRINPFPPDQYDLRLTAAFKIRALRELADKVDWCMAQVLSNVHTEVLSKPLTGS